MSNLTITGFPYISLNQYPGTTAFLRIYFEGCLNGNNFLSVDGAPIACGMVGSLSTPFFEVVCSVAGNTISIPTFSLPIPDPSNMATITCTAVFFDETDTQRDGLWSQWDLPLSLAPACTFPQLFTDNNGLQVPMVSSEVYTIPQVNFLLKNISFSIQVTTVAGLPSPAFPPDFRYATDALSPSWPVVGGSTGGYCVATEDGTWRCI